MELKVLNKPIEVTIGKKDNKFGIKFRQPTYIEFLEFQKIKNAEDVIKIVDMLFIDFINKPKLIDENKKEIEYNSLEEFYSLTLESLVQLELMNKIYNKMEEVLNSRAELIKK